MANTVVPKNQPNFAIKDDKLTEKIASATYSHNWNRWYMALPYSFKLRAGKEVLICNLPINPSNLSISTLFANNLIPTIGGTIEEHSDDRYFEIAITGTTGMAPKYTNATLQSDNNRAVTPTKDPETSGLWGNIKQYAESAVPGQGQKLNGLTPNNIGRDGYPIKLGSLGGFAKRTQQTVSNVLSNGLGIYNTWTGPKVYESAISYSKTGYAAFHNMYRFLLYARKQMKKAGSELYFENTKDGNQYRVVLHNFDMVRTAEDPMLYHYSIRMRGYNLRSTRGQDPQIQKDFDAARLNDLGLTGVDNATALSKVTATARKARNAAYAAAAIGKGGL